ncbi:nucleotidyltransferase family protein [Geosporobacter ferrireducens]|uniref:MobA-like NTP transferase domain-containing protein n=1 Tax=Geosporobacter ferrireducens TaxID=1424294 RepID=A0A1D8GGZ8_9FIRM|nr:nucleotidyltransferase family protein [Geosporobacter ferrireducens]AOT70179.1 hypothetical protein Gferi_11590 [Geosporobacter ferrireducens]MTI53274.1 molybdopterin-guanine dinucleotide biosynthesis protein A [Geosporobacter ferrireducens]
MTKAVILGGQGEALAGRLQNKSLLKIRDKAMIRYVIDALLETQCIDEILVIGDLEELKKLALDETVRIKQSSPSLIDNIQMGIEAFPKKRILISTSDIPMITKDAINDFVGQSLALEADLCYSVVQKETLEGRYPEAKRTFVKLADGIFTGGNLFFVDTEKVGRYMEIGRKMLMHRKNPLRMCSLLGIKCLLKLVIGKLSIKDIETRVENQMGIRGKAIISTYPEVGNDIDKPEDILIAEKYII